MYRGWSHGVAILGLVICLMVAVAQPSNPVPGFVPVSFKNAAIIAGGQGTVSGSYCTSFHQLLLIPIEEAGCHNCSPGTTGIRLLATGLRMWITRALISPSLLHSPMDESSGSPPRTAMPIGTSITELGSLTRMGQGIEE